MSESVHAAAESEEIGAVVNRMLDRHRKHVPVVLRREAGRHAGVARPLKLIAAPPS